MPNPLVSYDGTSVDMLKDGEVQERLQDIIDKLAGQSVSYLRRTDQLYHRIPEQLHDELVQVGWLAACEWCQGKDDGVIFRVCQIKRGTEREDPLVGELYERIYSAMNSYLYKDWSDRWVELRQTEALDEFIELFTQGVY